MYIYTYTYIYIYQKLVSGGGDSTTDFLFLGTQDHLERPRSVETVGENVGATTSTVFRKHVSMYFLPQRAEHLYQFFFTLKNKK